MWESYVNAVCPTCGRQEDPFCEHFVGWTEDGREVQVWEPDGECRVGAIAGRIPFDPDKHMIIKTGVTARVYHKPKE